MRRKNYFPYFVLGIVILCTLTLALSTSNRIRSSITRKFLVFRSRFDSDSETLLMKAEALQRRCDELTLTIEKLKEWISHEQRIELQAEKIANLDITNPLAKARQSHLIKTLSMQSQGIYANVIYREPVAWSSFIWINQGFKNAMIQKNSPVVYGNTLIGVVEQADEEVSKVRLITDVNLRPSVSAVRGKSQSDLLSKQLHFLLTTLRSRVETSDQTSALLSAISNIEFFLRSDTPDLFFAIGELQGSGQPLWKSRSSVLQGNGFLIDFPEEESDPFDVKHPILVGDLLVTTGLDGVFPSGLEVGIVSHVEALAEGESAYKIQAKSLIDLYDIKTVFILPPL